MRRFLCLLLVLCLMASLLVIPASATSVTTATFDGLAAVAAMIAGTGVTINAVENFPVFNTLVTSVFDHLTAQNIIDGAGTISALLSGQKTYIPVSVVQSVKSWLFDEKYIDTESFSSSGTLDIYGESFSYSKASAPIHYGKYSFRLPSVPSDSVRCVGLFVYSSKPFNLSGGGTDSRYYVFYKNTTSQFSDYPLLGTFSSYDEASLYLVNNFSIAYVPSSGLSFGEVPPSAVDSLEDNYPVWFDGAITHPPITLPGGTEDDEAIEYIPVSIPDYSASTPAIPPSQEVIWKGETTLSPGSDPGNSEEDSNVSFSDITRLDAA